MANHRKCDRGQQGSAHEPKSGTGNLGDVGTRLSAFAAAERPHRPVDAKALSNLTDGMHKQSETAGAFVRRMRDDSRY